MGCILQPYEDETLGIFASGVTTLLVSSTCTLSHAFPGHLPYPAAKHACVAPAVLNAPGSKPFTLLEMLPSFTQVGDGASGHNSPGLAINITNTKATVPAIKARTPPTSIPAAVSLFVGCCPASFLRAKFRKRFPVALASFSIAAFIF